MTSSSAVDNSPQPPPNAADPASAYDRAPTDQDVPCPLCEYNLRGASEPRCPECGYRFEWRDLLDPERRRHAYLFEHHPRHNAWSFTRTFKGALWPRRFWRELRPGQPSNVRRLIVYWLLTNVLALALPLAMIAVAMVHHAMNNQQQRAILMRNARSMGTRPPPQAWIDAMYPLPPSYQFFRQYFSGLDRGGLATPFVVAAVYTAWPWITFLALNVFQISMLRSRVNASHVLRCVVYTFDGIAVLCWALLLLAAMMIAVSELLIGIAYWQWIDTLFMAWIVVAAAVFTYRLSVAYRLYLQFHRPFLTVLASQIIVALAAFTAVLWIAMWNSPW